MTLEGTASDAITLTGLSALVVERQHLIAIDLERILAEAGATVTISHVLPARWPDPAGARAGATPARLAVVEMEGQERALVPLVAALQQAGVAIVLSTTAMEHARGHPDFPAVPVIVKPYDEDAVRRTLSRAILAGPHMPGIAALARP